MKLEKGIVTNQVFKDMQRRYNLFKKQNNREPKIIFIEPGRKEYVTLTVFKDMERRYENFKKERGREPLTVQITPPGKEAVNLEKGIVTNQVFKDMQRRYNLFKKENGREPQIIYIEPNKKEYVTLTVFKDMLNRYTTFLDENKREPKVIYIKGTTKDTGWVTTGYYKQDKQDTGYTCGPSSLQMALSALGCNVKEDELAKAAGTLNSGTPHKGMLKAVNYAAKKCKKNITAVFKYFSDIGWDGVIKHIKAGGEVVIHVVTRPGLDTDVNGRIIWKRAFGHYVYLVGVNKAKGQVRIADPTKGVVTFPVKGVEQAINNLSQPSILLIK